VGRPITSAGWRSCPDYLDFKKLKTGYLLIFDYSKKKQNKLEWIRFADKDIFAVWV
jgi:hypothetical protein